VAFNLSSSLLKSQSTSIAYTKCAMSEEFQITSRCWNKSTGITGYYENCFLNLFSAPFFISLVYMTYNFISTGPR